VGIGFTSYTVLMIVSLYSNDSAILSISSRPSLESAISRYRIPF